jgi:hypothetical protein
LTATVAYLAHEAGHLAGVGGDRVGQWARWGHIQASVSREDPRRERRGGRAGGERREAPRRERRGGRAGGERRESPHLYGFEDVAEAIAVHELLECGLSLRGIRRAVEVLGGPAAWPLANSGVHVVHGRLAVERGDELVDLLGSGAQEILPLDGRLDPVATLRRGGWPSRALGLECIEVDPERLGGRPVLKGRRIAVADAVTFEDPAEHGLSTAAVEEARAWLRAR